MKPVVLLSNGLQSAAVVMLIGSFFVEDNKKKINLRWAALGTFAVGYGLQFTPVYRKAVIHIKK